MNLSLSRHLLALAALLGAMLGVEPAVHAQTAGNLDPAYDPNVSLSGTTPYGIYPSVSALATQPDGKTIIGGSINNVGGTTINGIARLNADGTVDTTFNSGLPAGSYVSAVALLPDGRMLVSSSTTGSTVNGVAQSTPHFNRLNADGSVDATFNPPSNNVEAMVVQASGEVLLAARSLNSTAIAGTRSNGATVVIAQNNVAFVRLNADGTTNRVFVVTTDALPVGGLAVQSDGKILVRGDFTSFMGQPRNRIARINTDGSLDTGFNPATILWGTTPISIAAMAPLADGRLILTGSFPGPSGQPSIKIVRLTADSPLDTGILDGMFNAGSDADTGTFSLLVPQVDGKILVGGSFATIGGQPRAKIARLNGDGSVESTATFDAGSGIGNTSQSIFNGGGGVLSGPITVLGTEPLALALQSDGGILVGGNFSTVNGQTRNRMARLFNDAANQTLTVVDANQVQWQRGGSAPEAAQVSLQLSKDGGASWTMLGNGTRVAGGWQFTGLSLPASGIVRALAFSSGGGGITGQSQAFSGLPVFTVATSASPVAGGTISGGGNRAVNSTVTLVATPTAGYDFTGWTENGNPVSTATSYTFTATADRTLVANFTQRTCTIATNATPTVGGATSGGGILGQSTTVNLTASPAAGYNFANWSENGSIVSTGATLSFTAEGNRTLTANFTPKSYAIVASSSPSTQGSVIGGGAFNHGTPVTLVAKPAAGCKFVNWSENGSVINWATTLSFTAKENRTFVANFAPILTTSSNGNVTVNGFTLYSGAVLITEITNGTGWNGNVVAISVGTVGILGQPAPITYTVSTTASPATGGSVAGAGWVYPGASVTVLATPSPGYTFANWTENGTPVSTSASYTFTPTANRTVVANFTASNNANLAGLFSDQAKLTPVFDGNVTSYSARVPSGTAKFTLTPTLAQEGATFRINGIGASNGGFSPAIDLTSKVTTISLTVIAPNGATEKTYTVTVTRGENAKDLNNDDRSDLIFQNAAGQVFSWYMDGSGAIASSGWIYSGGLADWKIAGIADMNGDGKPDLVLQNNAGQIYVWYMNGGGGIASGGYLCTGALGGWRIAGIADMNGDGKADLVFQNPAGQIYAWYMDGSGGIVSSAWLCTGALGEWRLRRIADMDGDGNADLIFQNNAGQIYLWLMDGHGVTIIGGFLSTNGLADWKISAISDMNSDGIADLIFQNNAGQIYVWYMNASGAISSGAWICTGSLGEWRVR